MVNEDRVYEMIQLSLYDRRKAAEDKRAGDYFRGDYILSRMFASFFFGTAFFAVLLLLYCIYHFESLMLTIYGNSPAGFILGALICYIVVLAAYLTLTYAIYSRRYNRAVHALSLYSGALKELSEEYDRENL